MGVAPLVSGGHSCLGPPSPSLLACTQAENQGLPSIPSPCPRLPVSPAVPPNICIIEELCDGGSLHQRLHGRPGARRRAPLPYRELLAVAADVAAALCYLHPRIVHRDLKPQVGGEGGRLGRGGGQAARRAHVLGGG